MPSPLVATLFV